MDLSLIQKDILITLISLYHQYSHPIKGEDIADIIKRNPGTVRNQMQALKALGLVDGVPGPKGGYHPTSRAYSELNVTADDSEGEVAILRNNEMIDSVRVNEIDFTTLTHADLCHALIKVIGNVRIFEVGDKVTIGPTPVNKLLIKGEVFGKDEINSVLLISTSEMTSLPKLPIREYMTAPLVSLDADMTVAYVMKTLLQRRIHGAPVIEEGRLLGIVTQTDIVSAIDQGVPMDSPVADIMVRNVVTIPGDMRLYEVIRRFKEQDIGRVIVTEEGKPVGILTHSDIIRVFPTL
ncbi:MAG: CBS domain-containing protein [Methanocorpusculum sp.]|uniref:CBS domain-containing protein n=1 Tax=Methanocorpusculum petauri TaxID=3002863 RepID=A0ABT4IDT1_9EURY|nr:CBS domain-containing protein [Methanocorpusculum petauri]MCZ9312066.1 CBS domain-containing protein [Methanocorpusculum sp.]MCZ0859899.1 CBS domain-containing protein [Methanocorpusculum petauri]MDE2443736.1 CBS domain-containing protein [Methanocorpusculum sp.]MDE2518629.1 CBS domain-containing protein [Methanocorpusculum sp.]MDE2522998.1 CBS domain-containing protein [Methanocorpusculum sp.]